MTAHDTHGGNILGMARRMGCVPADILDFSANLNPLGPPAWLRPVVARTLADTAWYPEPQADSLCAAAALHLGIARDNVVAGNGSSELLYALPRLCRSRGLIRAVLPAPCYMDYARACTLAGMTCETLLTQPEAGFVPDWADLRARLDAPALVIMGQPGNPAGTLFAPERLLELADDHPDSFFVVDEAFADFVPDLLRLGGMLRPNIFVLHSLTKFYAMPGLRLGLGYGPADVCAGLHLPDWNVNGLAQTVGLAALADQDYARRTLETVPKLRESLRAELTALGLTVFPGQANYLLCRSNTPASRVQEALLPERILIRDCSCYPGLDAGYFRVAVRASEDNERLTRTLARIFAPALSRPSRPRPVPALMVQGLSSNAGKSVLTAALCRIFVQDGLRPMPFKAQNMSRHAHCCANGQMSLAQAVQARACRLEPDVRMNPVLLKPHSQTGSEVFVLGRSAGSMNVEAYINAKPRIFESITAAYDQLAATAQVMVLEGAGSPAEMNLKSHDVVNMPMARYARARVLLVGDIDRGGVFASLVGTMEVMEAWERALVAGFVINRFRGRQSLLDDAISYVHRFTGVETLGVVPFLPRLGLPEEDSLGRGPDSTIQMPDAAALDAALDRLADAVRASLDMERIYALLD